MLLQITRIPLLFWRHCRDVTINYVTSQGIKELFAASEDAPGGADAGHLGVHGAAADELRLRDGRQNGCAVCILLLC